MVKKSKSSLLKILKNPHKISDSEAMFIDELVKEFPYFQAACNSEGPRLWQVLTL